MNKNQVNKKGLATDDIYVALLRGINIGGRNLMAMPKLKLSFEKAGMQDVSTYINTGNVIFRKSQSYKPSKPSESSKSFRAALVAKLEEAIRQDFDLDIKVLLRSYGDFKPLINFLPDDWVNDAAMKCDVMFLWEDVDDPGILKELLQSDKKVITSINSKHPTQRGDEQLHYISNPANLSNAEAKGAVVWQAKRDRIAKCHSLQKLAANKVYKKMTVRNVNTTRKLYELMTELAKS